MLTLLALFRRISCEPDSKFTGRKAVFLGSLLAIETAVEGCNTGTWDCDIECVDSGRVWLLNETGAIEELELTFDDCETTGCDDCAYAKFIESGMVVELPALLLKFVEVESVCSLCFGFIKVSESSNGVWLCTDERRVGMICFFCCRCCC